MPTFEYDRRYIEHSLEILESFLLADTGYWPIDAQAPAGEPAYPMLTLEGLKLSMLRLSAYRGRLTYEHQIEKLNIELQLIQKRWTAAWEKKAQRAYHARLVMWGNYLNEYRNQPDAHADRYIYEVRLRVFLSILEQDVDKLDTKAETSLLKMDKFLKTLIIPGKFVWDDDILIVFPANQYWFLYGRIPVAIPDQILRSDQIWGENDR